MKLRRLITKRACARLTLLLVAGAIVNVAVAWGCVVRSEQRAMFGRLGDPPMTLSHDPLSTITHDWGLVQTSRCWELVATTWAVPVEVVDQAEFDQRLPWWSALRGRTAVEICYPLKLRLGAFDDYISELAAGWPFIALWSVNGAYSNKTTVGQLSIPVRKRNGDRGVMVPFKPIWPGFAINTVFYAAILWVLFAAPFALRRRLRVKRGLCVKCAYDRRGRAPTSEVCPECGIEVKA